MTFGGVGNSYSHSNSSSGSRSNPDSRENSTGGKRAREGGDTNTRSSKRHTPNTSVVPLSQPTSDPGVGNAMRSGNDLDAVVEALKSQRFDSLHETYTIFREGIAAARGGDVDQALGEMHARIKPVRDAALETARGFEEKDAASEMASMFLSLEQWHRSPETGMDSKCAIRNLEISMPRLEGLLQDFAPAALIPRTNQSTFGGNSTSVRSQQSTPFALPLAQGYNPPAQTPVQPSLAMSQQPSTVTPAIPPMLRIRAQRLQRELRGPAPTIATLDQFAKVLKAVNLRTLVENVPNQSSAIKDAADCLLKAVDNAQVERDRQSIMQGMGVPTSDEDARRLANALAEVSRWAKSLDIAFQGWSKPAGSANPTHTVAPTQSVRHPAPLPLQTTQTTVPAALPWVSTIRPGMTIPPKPTDTLPPLPPRSPNPSQTFYPTWAATHPDPPANGTTGSAEAVCDAAPEDELHPTDETARAAMEPCPCHSRAPRRATSLRRGMSGSPVGSTPPSEIWSPLPPSTARPTPKTRTPSILAGCRMPCIP